MNAGFVCGQSATVECIKCPKSGQVPRNVMFEKPWQLSVPPSQGDCWGVDMPCSMCAGLTKALFPEGSARWLFFVLLDLWSLCSCQWTSLEGAQCQPCSVFLVFGVEKNMWLRGCVHGMGMGCVRHGYCNLLPVALGRAQSCLWYSRYSLGHDWFGHCFQKRAWVSALLATQHPLGSCDSALLCKLMRHLSVLTYTPHSWPRSD